MGINNLMMYNTLTRKIEEFYTIEKGKVSLYTCGPTVYNYSHIGNLRTYIFGDMLKRILSYAGYKIKHVMNITDVGHLVSDEDTGEDKMEVGSIRENKSAWELAAFYLEAFKNDMRQLHINEPDVWCRATDHISEQINFIKRLEEKGYTYIIRDGVYFDTSKVSDYGKLAKLDIEGLKAGSRVKLSEGKRNITDFALWKFSPHNKKRQMEWNSPWGIGFPGWHIECSAMAMKYLGERIDIHCGGIDHIAVHHTNEIAQSESLTEQQWVNWWLHGEFLVLDKNEKMAKSGENFLTLQSIINHGINPLAYRYFCLNAHYRSPLFFSWEGVESANNAFKRLQSRIIEFKNVAEKENGCLVCEKYLNKFEKAIENDMNIPQCLAAMWDLIKDSDIYQKEKYYTLLEMDKILGFDFITMQDTNHSIEEDIAKMINERQNARRFKDFKTADRIRRELENRGIVLEDTLEGAKIKFRFS